jgi:capsular exopolysaccharide synthesis family protein
MTDPTAITAPTPSPVPAKAHSAHAANSKHQGFDWREYYIAVRSRFWIVILSLMIFTLIGLFKAATTHAQFSARTVLFIEQTKSRVLNVKLEDVRDDQIKSMDMINTVIDLLRSYPFALRVVNHNKLSRDAAFLTAAGIGGTETTPEQAAYVLAKMVTPGYRLNTRLIDIVITTRTASVSVKLANEYAEEYLRYIQDQRIGATKEASSFLADESDRLRKKMRAAEEGMQAFRERERAASIDSMLQEAQGQITKLSERNQQIDVRLTQLNSDLKVARESKGNPRDLLRLPSVAEEAKVSALLTQIDTMQNNLALAKQRYRDKHPTIIALKTQLELANNALSKVLTDVVGLLESIRVNLTAQQEATKTQRSEAERRLLEVTSKSIEYNDLRRELESDSVLYNAVLSRIKEVDVTKELDESPVHIQEPATAAYSISVGPMQILFKFLMIGIGVGIGICIAIHKLDTSIKTIDELEHYTLLPVVTAVPQIGGASETNFGFLSKQQYFAAVQAWKAMVTNFQESASKPFQVRILEALEALRPIIAMVGRPNLGTSIAPGQELVLKDNPSGTVSEAFRSLRASVAMNPLAVTQRTFLLTSAFPSEGKSFCSCNFSISLAQQGLRTLLIDADLRKPTVSRLFFGAHRKPGLSEVLLGRTTLEEARIPSGVDGLDILTSGGRSTHPSELLAGDPFQNLLVEALKTYDRVVVDSAPVLAVSDTTLIAPRVDVVCLVVRSFVTPRKIVNRALKTLAEIHVQPQGIIFNGVPSGTGSYYAYYYSGRYYGHYGNKGVYGA